MSVSSNSTENKAVEPAPAKRISQSSIPAFTLSALFLGSAFAPPNLRSRTYTPPFLLRLGFGTIFAGAGYMLASGDSRNGSGVATAWTLSYLLLEQFTQGLKKSERYPRSGLAWVLSGAAATSAALYGTEHFIFQSDEDDTDGRGQHAL